MLQGLSLKFHFFQYAIYIQRSTLKSQNSPGQQAWMTQDKESCWKQVY